MECPNCSTRFGKLLGFSAQGGGSIKTAEATPSDRVKVINKILGMKQTALCTKCESPFINDVRTIIASTADKLKGEVSHALSYVPVVTVDQPYQWEYQVSGLVTAQSVTGTGVFSEIGASLTDFFGMQSGTFRIKLKQGEDYCLAQIKTAALALGANAIIGVDIDYADVGVGKGMLMVCIAGTAVRVTDPLMNPEKARCLNTGSAAAARLRDYSLFLDAYG